MLLMLREDQFCIRFVIGARIIRGIGAVQLRIVGGSLAMCMILGISQTRDVLGMKLLEFLECGS